MGYFVIELLCFERGSPHHTEVFSHTWMEFKKIHGLYFHLFLLYCYYKILFNILMEILFYKRLLLLPYTAVVYDCHFLSRLQMSLPL